MLAGPVCNSCAGRISIIDAELLVTRPSLAPLDDRDHLESLVHHVLIRIRKGVSRQGSPQTKLADHLPTAKHKLMEGDYRV